MKYELNQETQKVEQVHADGTRIAMSQREVDRAINALLQGETVQTVSLEDADKIETLKAKNESLKQAIRALSGD